jgi:hypothetical protein
MGILVITCTYCSEQFTAIEMFMEHLKTFHLKCECGEVFSAVENTKDLIIKCGKCRETEENV